MTSSLVVVSAMFFNLSPMQRQGANFTVPIRHVCRDLQPTFSTNTHSFNPFIPPEVRPRTPETYIHHDSLWFIIKCFASSTGEQDGLSANRESSYILHFWRRDLTKRAVARRKRSMFTPFAQKALNVWWFGNSRRSSMVIPSASMGPRNHFANSKLKLYRFVPILRRVEDWPWSNMEQPHHTTKGPKVIDGENQWRLLNLLSISSVSKLGSPNFPWLIIVLCIKNCH